MNTLPGVRDVDNPSVRAHGFRLSPECGQGGMTRQALPATAPPCPPSPPLQPARYLTGLHDVMASRASAQAKLNKVVKIIAEAMASEVCSIYLLRDGVLELFATVGPQPERGPRHQAGAGRGAGRDDRQGRLHPQPRRGAEPPRIRLPAGDRRGAVPQLRRGSDRPPRAGDRRARASSMPRPAPMTSSRSRRFRRWRWCSPS